MVWHHLVLPESPFKSAQNTPFLRVDWGVGQRLTCKSSVRVDQVAGRWGSQAKSTQAGDHLLDQVELLEACSWTSEMRYTCGHTTGGSGTDLSEGIPVPSNIC